MPNEVMERCLCGKSQYPIMFVMSAILLVVGPHGVGKDTLIDAVLGSNSKASRIRRHITRQLQEVEKMHGNYIHADYFEFSRLVSEGAFAEFAHHGDSSSGTSWSELLRSDDSVGLVSINPDDALVLSSVLVDRDINATRCFVSPVEELIFHESPFAYLRELERRMRLRGRVTDDISRRLKDALLFRELEIDLPSEYFIENTRGCQLSSMLQLNRIVADMVGKK